jgi:hypothetical protein
LFVVLLVILSLLMTAATVVYINKEDIQRDSLTKVKAQLDAKTQSEQNLQAQVTALQQNLQAGVQQATDQAGRANADIIKLQNEKASQGVELAKFTSQVATQQLDVSRLTEALNATQAAAQKQADEIARLRTANDTLVKQSADLNATVSDLTNKLDVTERERRLLAEQLTQTKGENQRLGAIINGAHLAPEQQNVAVNRGGPSINGVIRDVRTIAGNQYATISVGSADSVTRGMEFKVIDRGTGNFLGTLVVDTVEPNESTGRLFGPNVAAIRPGVEVRTQL